MAATSTYRRSRRLCACLCFLPSTERSEEEEEEPPQPFCDYRTEGRVKKTKKKKKKMKKMSATTKVSV